MRFYSEFLGKTRNVVSLLSILAIAGCGGGDGSSDTGTTSPQTPPQTPPPSQTTGQVSGHVAEYLTNANVGGAQVTLTATNNGQQTRVAQVTTDANGLFSINNIGISDHFVLAVTAPGFGEQARNFSNSSTAPNMTVDALLNTAAIQTTFDPTIAKVFSVGGAQLVSLPANALVSANGSRPTGAVTANITIIDPAADTSVMPGDYQTLNTVTAALQPIQSYGALSVRFTDANGQPLQLGSGMNSTISIPLSAGVAAGQAPATIPLYYFNSATGYWVEEGTATLQSAGGANYYVGQVSHFTVWNADQVYTTVIVNGCVKDGAGNPVALARVNAFGQNYIGSSAALSNSNGEFSIPARISSSVLISASSSFQSQTQIVSTTNQSTTLTSCLILSPDAASIKLTWGENPSDLDSHFIGPSTGGSGTFHIYYAAPSALVNATTFSLDVDDTDSFGPEIVSIPTFPNAGTYSYFVHNYSGANGETTGDIKQSPARIEIHINGQTTVFSPNMATGAVTNSWHVFDFVVDSSLHATIVPIQQFVVDTLGASGPTQTVLARAPAPASIQNSVAPTNSTILKQLISDKYYAK